MRKVYSLEGALVRNLEDIKDGGLYVASGGDMLKKVPYLMEEDSANEISIKEGKSKNKAKHVSYGMLNSDINNIFNRNERPIFGASTKGFKVMLFNNGDPSEPVKVLLNYRNCRTFEQLLRFLSTLLRLPSGQVRKLYDAVTHKKVNSLQDLSDGQNLVAVTIDPFKKVAYQVVDLNFKAPNVHDTTRIAHFFPNGDPYHMGISVSVTKKRFNSLNKVSIRYFY